MLNVINVNNLPLSSMSAVISAAVEALNPLTISIIFPTTSPAA